MSMKSQTHAETMRRTGQALPRYPHHVSTFHLPLLGTASSNFGFLCDSSIEVHLAAYSEGTGKNDKGSLEVPKKKQFLPTSRD